MDAAGGAITTGLGLPYLEGAPSPGKDRYWVASNEDGSKVWRADYLGGDRSINSYTFKLTGAPVAMEDRGIPKQSACGNTASATKSVKAPSPAFAALSRTSMN